MTIRILHVVSSLVVNSGVMSVIMNYYRHINKNLIQFDFLYFESAEDACVEEIKKLGGNVYYVSKPSLKAIWGNYKEFKKFFENNASKYAAIHLHEVYLVHLFQYFKQKYGIKRLITHAHTTKYSDDYLRAIRNRLMCIGLKRCATDYFACSEAAGEFYYGKEAVACGRVKIIKNAIDIEKYKFNEKIRNKVRKELNIQRKFVVGHIGRMMPQKNQIFLLEVFKKVRKFEPDAVLLMIGDGPLKPKLENKIDELKLKESIVLLGIRRDVPDILMAMDIFLLPSLYEGLGVVAIEAQTTGLPCVLSDVVTREVNLGNCSFISLNETVDKWATRILDIRKGHIRRKGIIKEAKEFGYDIRSEVQAIETLYLNCKRVSL